MADFNHITVLLNEAVDALITTPDGTYVDCTLGGGGHTKNILNHLSATGHLYSFDQDDTAITYNRKQLAPAIAAGHLTLVESNFRNLKEALTHHGVQRVTGVLYDLGVSSPQFDDAERGFSYRYDAPLDMRMDQRQALTAQTVVNEWEYGQLVKIFHRYGDEKFAKQIARRIEKVRQDHPIVTTGELVDIIKTAIPARARRTGGHPARKVFQAIRIAVNDEMGALEASLHQALDLLAVGGRVAVITFQPLEDRIVKDIFREHSQVRDVPQGLPVIPPELQPDFKLVTRKPIVPSATELANNRRAHSARLRVIERIK